jgi:Rrf2 family protein
MFTLTTKYALRAAVWLAEKQGLPQTTRQIASATCVPVNYLSKVLRSLGKAGLVRALRGKHGGFELAKAPSSTSVLEIINVVEPIQRIPSFGIENHSQSCVHSTSGWIMPWKSEESLLVQLWPIC